MLLNLKNEVLAHVHEPVFLTFLYLMYDNQGFHEGKL